MAAIKLTLIFTLLSFLSLSQKLEQRVSIDVRDQSIKNILLRLETVADVKFSYSNQILSSDKKTSIQCSQKPLRAVLIQLLGTSYKFKEVKGYVIISKEKVAPDELLLKGYVYDSKGSPLKEATVFERRSMRSKNTDPNGYYELRIKRDVRPDSIFIRKYNYTGRDLGLIDTTLSYTSTLLNADSTAQQLKAINKLHRGADYLSQSISSFWYKQQVTALNVNDTIHRMFQITFVPYIGTNRKLSANSINSASFNILGGYAYANRGVEFAGLFNTNRTYSRGVQFAGLFNINGTESNGAQFAGLFNLNSGNARGAQFAGLFNLNGGSFQGAQFAGLFNFCQEESQSTSLAGLVNIHSQTPVQIAPFNVAQKSTVQIGVMNFASKSHFQLGVINVADSISGIPIGVLNFVKSGYHKLDIGYDSEAHLNVSFRTGVPAFYTILNSSIRVQHRDSTEWTFGYGIGTSPRLGKRMLLNIDLTSSQMVEGGRIEYLHLTNRLSTGLEYQITSWFAVYAAAVINHGFYDMQSTYRPYSESRTILYSTSDQQFKSEVWPGWRVGIRFF